MQDLKQKISAAVADDLAAVEKALAENLKPHFELVAQTAEHILFAGGKRLRPLLMVLAARLNGYDGPAASNLAVVFEYLHAATLLHDDLVDGASVRRGQPVANKVFGNATAVLVGDFLLARSLSVAAESGKLEIIKIIAGITEHMSQGEIEQLRRKKDLHLDEAGYMEVIDYKTARLIQGACRVGAILAEADAAREKALADFGYNLGLAFQMADDLLDYTADSEDLGKLAGADLNEGKLTLPLIYALQEAGGQDCTTMTDIILRQGNQAGDFEMLRHLLTVHGGIAYTRQKAARHVKKAQALLSIFKPGTTRQLLHDIATYALQRRL